MRAPSSFGELALLHAAPRAATIRAIGKSKCELWAVDRELFQSFVATQSAMVAGEKLRMLRQVEILQPLTTAQMTSVAEAVVEETFLKGENIITQVWSGGGGKYSARLGWCLVGCGKYRGYMPMSIPECILCAKAAKAANANAISIGIVLALCCCVFLFPMFFLLLLLLLLFLCCISMQTGGEMQVCAILQLH